MNRPRPARDILPRARLLEQLNQGRDQPLILVSAPAGYGKTTLVSRWLDTRGRPSAWISLDENDNDLQLFLSYFTNAIESIAPDACRDTKTLINTVKLPPESVLLDNLINELNLIEPAFILVLDDYYRIKNPAVHHLVNALLRHPALPMNLVIVSRYDPPLALSAFRARNQMTEIRTRDLRFSTDETTVFLKHLIGFEIEVALAARINEKSEGWVTGLRLMVMAVKQQDHIERLLKDLPVDAQYAREYLFDEVLSRQPAEVSQMLMLTAFFDRFCAPLCEVLGSALKGNQSVAINGWDFLAWTRKKNLFIVPLDIDNQWFRYHHFFQRLLINQAHRYYSPETIAALHQSASAWFADNELIEEALNHVLVVGDTETAGRLVARFSSKLMNAQQWQRLERCLYKLPRDRIEGDPALLVIVAWLDFIRHNPTGVTTCVEKIEALNAAAPTGIFANVEHVQGPYEAFKGFHYYMAADGARALNCFQRALEQIPAHHKRARLLADNGLAASHQMIGDLATGLSIYQKAMERYINRDNNYHAIYLGKLGLIYWMDADLTALEHTAEGILDVANKAPQSAIPPYYRLYFLGVIHYLRNELPEAVEKLTRVVEAHYRASPINFAHSAFALALTYQALGKPDQAAEVCRSVVADSIETNNTDMLQVARAFEAELALHQGRLNTAFQWAQTYPAKPFRPTFRFYMPQLTFIKTLLARDTQDSRQQAADLLDELYAFLKSIHNRRFQIEVLAMQALLFGRMDQTREAHSRLERALELGEPGGFIRPFVDLGSSVADLLKRLSKQNVAVDQVEKILAAFKDDDQVLAPEATRDASPPTLVEPLTNRELDVLELLARRLQNKEIAAKLSISVETVKKHLSNIYQKLDVSSRRQAVDQAGALGILSRR